MVFLEIRFLFKKKLFRALRPDQKFLYSAKKPSPPSNLLKTIFTDDSSASEYAINESNINVAITKMPITVSEFETTLMMSLKVQK